MTRHVALERIVVRTSLLPFEVLARWSGEPTELRRELRRLVEDPVVREALFLASPELASNIGVWIERPDDPATRELEIALVRYLCRMAARVTPSGLMSGVGLGRIGTVTKLAIAGRGGARRNVQIARDYLARICEALATSPEIRAALRYSPSSSLCIAGSKLRYVASRGIGSARSYGLTSIEPSDILLALLNRAQSGATIAELAALLCENPTVGAEAARELVSSLIDIQILVPDLCLPIVDLDAMIDGLEQIPAAAPLALALASTRHALAGIASARLGLSLQPYRAIADQLERDAPVAPRRDRLFQADLFRASPEFVLGPHVVDEVTRAVELLTRIGGSAPDDPLGRFRGAFVERYGQRTVPLVDALHDELGIGFHTPAPRPSLLVPFPSLPVRTRHVRWTERDQHLLRLLHRAIRADEIEVELDADDEAALADWVPARVSDLLAVSITIAGTSNAAIEDNQYLVRIVGAVAPGLRSVARYSPELASELAADEHKRRPAAIFAELVCPCELYSLDLAVPIPISDLMVSVVGKRVVLTSLRHDKEVIPRLSAAPDDEARSLGIYAFLCALAGQDGGGVAFDWGPLGDSPFLPRIRSGRVVLSRACWQLVAGDILPIAAAARVDRETKHTDDTAIVNAVAALRRRFGLPRWIAVADGAGELPVDLDNRMMVVSFAHLLRARTLATLHELFPPPDEMAVRGPEGTFDHELELFYSRHREPVIMPARRRAGTPIQRTFVPGSSWLYAKFFAGYAACDDLVRAIAPLARELVKAGDVAHWFFTRNSEPDWHLRVRFCGAPAALISRVLPRLERLAQPFLETGALARLQIDTYEREVERYGGPEAIELVEQIFAADSDAVATILEAYSGEDAPERMWRLALRGIDRLLEDLGLELPIRQALVGAMRDQLGAELGMTAEHAQRFSDKFRRHREEIEQLFADQSAAYAEGSAALIERSAAIRPLAAELHRRLDSGLVTATLAELASSLAHVHVNRILAAAPRPQELVLYDLLYRHYRAGE